MSEKKIILQLHDEYQQDGKWVLALVILAMLVIISLLFFYAQLQFFDDPEPKYIKMSKEQQLIVEQPLEQPLLEDNELANWAVQTMVKALSFNFVNAKEVLENAKKNFFPEGFIDFTEGISNIEFIRTLRSQRVVVVANTKKAPEITKKGLSKGVYYWVLEFPLELVFFGGDARRIVNVDIALMVNRVSVKDLPIGVKIKKAKISSNIAIIQRNPAVL